MPHDVAGAALTRAAQAARQCLATVVVVPRERFDLAIKSFASLLASIDPAVPIVYVTAGLPRAAEQAIRARARGRPLIIVPCKAYLTPNQARNLALPHIRTKYIAFADNDVLFVPGWLEALVRRAEATAAAVVSPLICMGAPAHSVVHFAGGIATIIERDGKRLFREAHHFVNQPVAAVRDRVERGPIEFAEFHCVLVRRSVFERHGPLDEALLCAHEHLDLALTVRASGGSIYLEPDAIVTYMTPALPLSGLPYYAMRWSDSWSRASDRHFLRKWGVAFATGVAHRDTFVRRHRSHSAPRLRKAFYALGGWRLGTLACDLMDRAAAALALPRFAGSEAKRRRTVVRAGLAWPAMAALPAPRRRPF